jgi:hypothetical protein
MYAWDEILVIFLHVSLQGLIKFQDSTQFLKAHIVGSIWYICIWYNYIHTKSYYQKNAYLQHAKTT